VHVAPADKIAPTEFLDRWNNFLAIFLNFAASFTSIFAIKYPAIAGPVSVSSNIA